MYFLSLLCGLWSGSMEIGDFIWQFYISPPPPPPFHTLTLILTTPTLCTKYITFWIFWILYWFSYIGVRSSQRSISLPNFSLFTVCTSISIWKEREFRCDFLLSGLLRWLHWKEGQKWNPIKSQTSHLFITNYFFSRLWSGNGGIHGHTSIFLFSISCTSCICCSFFVCLSFCCTFSV